MSLAALSPQGVVAGATRRQLGKLQPLALKAGQSPLMAMTSIRNPTAVDRTSSPRRCRVLGRGGAFRGSRHLPRHRFDPHGFPGPAVGLCLLLRQGTLAAN